MLSGAKRSLVFQGKPHRFSKKESPRVHLREEAGSVLLVILSVLDWKSIEMTVFHVRNLAFQSKVLGAGGLTYCLGCKIFVWYQSKKKLILK